MTTETSELGRQTRLPRRSRMTALVLGFTCVLIITVALLAIYYQQPSLTVQAITLLIIALGFWLVLTGGWREIGVLLLLTVLISTVSVAIVFADTRQPFPFVAPIAWMLLFAGIISLFWNATLKVGPDEIVVIRSLVDGSTRELTRTVVLPPVAGWEEIAARAPTYPLSVMATVKDIPTKSNRRVPAIKVSARYRIKSVVELHANVTNRGQIYDDVSKELGLEKRKAMNEQRFWELVARKQAESAISSNLRRLIWDRVPDPQTAFTERDWSSELDEKVRATLRSRGLEPLSVTLLEVDTAEIGYTEDSERARHEADTSATRYAMMVDRMLEKIGDRCNQLSADEVRAVVMQAIREVQEQDRMARIYGADARPGA